MTKLIIARYDSKGAVANAFDDLISTGIPEEKIRIDKERHAISVMAPPTSEAEITEILRRHRPLEVKKREDVPA